MASSMKPLSWFWLRQNLTKHDLGRCTLAFLLMVMWYEIDAKHTPENDNSHQRRNLQVDSFPTVSQSTPTNVPSVLQPTTFPSTSASTFAPAPSSSIPASTFPPSLFPSSSLAPTVPITPEDLINWEYENVVALRWNIQNPPEVSYSGLTFDLHFKVSDYVQIDSHVRYDLYEGAICGDDANLMTDAGYITTEVADDGTPVGGGINTRTVTVSNTLDPQTISKSRSYQEESANDASITYCVRFSLWSGPSTDAGATLVNAVDATVALSVDLTDDFSIQGQQFEAREQDVKTSEDKFFVEAFLCHDNGEPLEDILPFVQGEILRICVRPTQQAFDVGFRMKRIDRFTFAQGYTTQEAVINEDAASNGLTELYCSPGAEQCMFETLLFAYFFQSETSIVQGSGSATLQWGEETSGQEPSFRSLRASRNSAKEITIPDVGLRRVDNYPFQHTSSGGGYRIPLASTGLALLLALLSVCHLIFVVTL